MSFKSTYNRGFQMTFDNGLTISVQWGRFNYCERKKSVYLSDELKDVIVESKDAEIAIWDNNNSKKFLNFGSNEVKGYCTTNEVAQWIHRVSMIPSFDSLQDFIKDHETLDKLFGNVE